MHVDNSACNLASLNLLTFLDDEGNFDVDGYRALRDMGVTHLQTMPWVFYGKANDAQAKCDGIHRFAEDVIEKMD